MVNNTFRIVRRVVFGVANAFALAVLILAALITHFTTTLYFGGYFTFAALAIATSLLTILSLPVMLFLARTRKGAITSMIAIELAWTWFLWIMWLATAGSSASVGWLSVCGDLFYTDIEAACRESQALTAFAFITWAALFGYNIFLIVLVIRQHMRGNSGVWTGYVLETDFTAPGPVHAPVHDKMQSEQSFAPQYPPQGTPVQAAPAPAFVPQHQMVQQPTTATTSPYPQV